MSDSRQGSTETRGIDLDNINKACGAAGSPTIIGLCTERKEFHEREARLWSAMEDVMIHSFQKMSDDEKGNVRILLCRLIADSKRHG